MTSFSSSMFKQKYFKIDRRDSTRGQDPRAITLLIPGLAGTLVTPPLPDVDRLPKAHNGGLVIVRPILMYAHVWCTKLDDEREVRQFDLVDLIEGLLANTQVGA